MTTKPMTAGEFAAALSAANLSKTDAAEVIGVNLRTVYRWLTGETRISVAYTVLIRERLATRFQLFR